MLFIIRILSSLMMLIIATSGIVALAHPGVEMEADSLPSYVIVINDRATYSPASLPDSVFDRIAGSTVFPVNRSDLNMSDPLLRELATVVLPLANAEDWMLIAIDMRGAASPEGSYSGNQQLALRRAAALTQFVTERMDSVYLSDIHSHSLAEDYAYLLTLMVRADDPSAAAVRDIIARCGIDNPQAIKAALRKAEGGKLWSRLLDEYFPQMRSARIVLVFKRIYPKPLDMTLVDPSPIERIELPPLAEASPNLIRFQHEFTVSRPHLLSVGSNILYDAFYMPQYGMAPLLNIALEYYPRSGNFTYRFAFLFPYYHRWKRHKFFQIRDYHFEVRRYFRPGELHTGAYLGLYANVNKYGIGLSATKGWEGEGWGGALKFGYVLPLGNGRWRLDFHIAAGGYVTRYDPYVYGNPITGADTGDYYYDYTGAQSQFKRRNHRLTWIGPTEAGITLTFDLLYHKKTLQP